MIARRRWGWAAVLAVLIAVAGCVDGPDEVVETEAPAGDPRAVMPAPATPRQQASAMSQLMAEMPMANPDLPRDPIAPTAPTAPAGPDTLTDHGAPAPQAVFFFGDGGGGPPIDAPPGNEGEYCAGYKRCETNADCVGQPSAQANPSPADQSCCMNCPACVRHCYSCGGGGGDQAANACGNRVCGTALDAEGRPVSCGTCPAGKTCNGDGQCQDCPRKTCGDYLGRCGQLSDGCGAEIACTCPNGADPEFTTCAIDDTGSWATTTPQRSGVCGCADNDPACPVGGVAPSPALQRFDLHSDAGYLCTAAIAVAPWLPLQRGLRVRAEGTFARIAECKQDNCSPTSGGSITVGGAVEVCGIGGYANFTHQETETETRCVVCEDGRNVCGPTVKSSKKMTGTIEVGVTGTFDVNPIVVVADRVGAGGVVKKVFKYWGETCDNWDFGSGYANVRGGITFSSSNTRDTKGPGGPQCPAQGLNCQTEDWQLGLRLGARVEVDLTCRPRVFRLFKRLGDIETQFAADIRFDVGGSIGREYRTGECGDRACTKGSVNGSALLSLGGGFSFLGTGATLSVDGKCWFNKTWADGCGSSTPLDVGCKLDWGVGVGGPPRNGD